MVINVLFMENILNNLTYDYEQDLDVLKKDIEFALSVIEYNRSIFKKFSSLFENKIIFVYQGGHHLDIIDRDKGSLK